MVTALLGGFDQVASEEPGTLPAVAVDDEFNGGPWVITVESAQVGRNLRNYHPQNERDLVLQVNVRIAKVDNCICSVLDAITVRDLPVRSTLGQSEDDDGVPPERIRSLRDNSLTLQAQVGLPIRVAYLWEIAEGTPLPDEITVVIYGGIRRYQNFRFLGTTIENYDPMATVTVPVLDRTVAA